jgi:transposase
VHLTAFAKAKVEGCVGIVERWLIGRLRNRIFHSLAEVNKAIGEMLQHLNEERPIRRIGKTRRQLLEELDRPALEPLPIEPYVFAEWRFCRVGIDYHVDVGEHFYSVPYSYGRCEVEVRLTARTVEIFLKGKRIAAHVRGSEQPCSHDHPRPHAIQSSALCRLDHRSYPPGCGQHRPLNGYAV